MLTIAIGSHRHKRTPNRANRDGQQFRQGASARRQSEKGRPAPRMLPELDTLFVGD